MIRSPCQSIDDRVWCLYKFVWCGFETKNSNLVTPKYFGLLYTGQYRQRINCPLKYCNLAANERESRNPSRMSRLSVNRQTREQINVSTLNSVKSGLLAKSGESTTFWMPKPNICNRHCAMCGSCMDDDIHSQLLFENNSKSITCMSEIGLKYWTVSWPKNQQLSNGRTQSFLQNLDSLSL
jgi:hypothetical protein